MTDWNNILKNGILAGLTPKEIYNLELWEYNQVIDCYEIKYKFDIEKSILTGYYTAYYINNGNKAKTPKEIMESMFSSKRDYKIDLEQIKKIKKQEGEVKTNGRQYGGKNDKGTPKH